MIALNLVANRDASGKTSNIGVKFVAIIERSPIDPDNSIEGL